jgi:acyl carrier protein
VTDPRTDEILAVIEKEALVDRSRLTPDAKLGELGIASIDIISIVFALEDRLGLELSGDDLEGCETVGDLLRVIDEKASGAAAA